MGGERGLRVKYRVFIELIGVRDNNVLIFILFRNFDFNTYILEMNNNDIIKFRYSRCMN